MFIGFHFSLQIRFEMRFISGYIYFSNLIFYPEIGKCNSAGNCFKYWKTWCFCNLMFCMLASLEGARKTKMIVLIYDGFLIKCWLWFVDHIDDGFFIVCTLWFVDGVDDGFLMVVRLWCWWCCLYGSLHAYDIDSCLLGWFANCLLLTMFCWCFVDGVDYGLLMVVY